MKILMNAEAFGFGPSAAIAAIFPKIKGYEFITQIDYLGNGHSLDLQRKLPYNQIIESHSKEHFDSIIKNYDVFITSLDFERATWAQEAGIPTIIYDTLLWYWRKIPSSLLNCHAYITQDFYGVKERIKGLNIQNAVLVPPLIKQKSSLEEVTKDIILVNFGGLENPHWNSEITFNYITNMLDILLPILKKQNKEIKILCSKKHIERFVEQYGEPAYHGYKVENCSYDQMQNYLQRTALLLATPGLGNIYECANYKIPSIFLPPANDSQGQQLEILINKRLVDSYISWDSLTNKKVDYFDAQIPVLNSISSCIDILNSSKNNLFITENIENILLKLPLGKNNLNLKELINSFGSDGLELITKTIIDNLKEIRAKNAEFLL
jgi:hypothetical protein